MKENIDLATAFEMIQDYAIKSVFPTYKAFSNSVDITKHPEAYPLPPRILTKIPDEILKLHGEVIGARKWKKLATSFFRLTLIADVRVEVAKLMRDVLEMWDEERKFMYKGKDGNNYTSFEQVRSVDELYVQQENPAKEQGRSR